MHAGFPGGWWFVLIHLNWSHTHRCSLMIKEEELGEELVSITSQLCCLLHWLVWLSTVQPPGKNAKYKENTPFYVKTSPWGKMCHCLIINTWKTGEIQKLRQLHFNSCVVSRCAPSRRARWSGWWSTWWRRSGGRTPPTSPSSCAPTAASPPPSRSWTCCSTGEDYRPC